MKEIQRVGTVQSRHSKTRVSKNVLLKKKNYKSIASHIFPRAIWPFYPCSYPSGVGFIFTDTDPERSEWEMILPITHALSVHVCQAVHVAWQNLSFKVTSQWFLLNTLFAVRPSFTQILLFKQFRCLVISTGMFIWLVNVTFKSMSPSFMSASSKNTVLLFLFWLEMLVSFGLDGCYCWERTVVME